MRGGALGGGVLKVGIMRWKRAPQPISDAAATRENGVARPLSDGP